MSDESLNYFKNLVWHGLSQNSLRFSKEKALSHFATTGDGELLQKQLAFLKYVEEVLNDIEEDVLNGTYFEGEQDE